MKKFSLFLSFLLAFSLTAKAQISEGSLEPNVVLVEDAAEELTDGTVIALQSRDYSAGAGYYFAGARQKTSTFSVNNLFVVEGNAKEGMKLRQFQGEKKYIGKSNSSVSEVVSAGSAATFTAKSKGKSSSFPYSPTTPMDNTDDNLYVRFTTAGSHLNTRNFGDAPQYGTGTAGYSVWYVYKFPKYTLNLQQVSKASLSFERTGTTAGDVKVSVNLFDGDDGDDDQNGVKVVFETKSFQNNNLQNQNLKNNNDFSSKWSNILCPDINIGTAPNNPYAILKFTLSGLEGFNFNKVLLQMKPYDTNGNYLDGGRRCNVDLICGEGEDAWSTLTNINISPIVDWQMTGETVTAEDGNLVLTLKITRPTAGTSSGFFFGLSGITLIDEERESKDFSEETITEMKITDVEDLLKVIESGYENINQLNGDTESDKEDFKYKFPVLADAVNAENVVWPSTLNNVFNGLDSNFKLLTHAENAIKEKNTNNLDIAKQNLADFIRISNKIYPVSVAYTAAADYGTFYTPFDVATLPEGLAFFQCTGCEDGVLQLDDSQSLTANTAYIVKTISADANGKTVQLIDFSGSLSNTQANGNSPLKGTHTGTTAPADSYVLQNQNEYGLGFYLVGQEGKYVPAGKCYLDLSGENAQGLQFLRFPDGTLTAIDAIDAAEPANAATYDLSGRRVTTTTTRGLYIMGGRKVLVK